MPPRCSRRLNTSLLAALTVWACLVAAGCSRQLVDTPNLYAYVERDINPFEDVPAALRSPIVDVIYATDRRRLESAPGHVRYGHRRSTSLAFGECAVRFGEDLDWETLVELSRSAERSVSVPLAVVATKEIGRFPPTPAPLEVGPDGAARVDPAHTEAYREAEASFHALLGARLAETPRKDVFIYVHGASTSMDQSVFRLAEMWHFLARQGVPVAYSWPAGHPGLLRGYSHDRESSEFTGFHFRRFLLSVASCPGVEDVHLIGHSRGTDVILRALSDIMLYCEGAGIDPLERFRIGQVVLAAPDVDYQVMRQRAAANRVHRTFRNVTVFVTADDLALGSAEWLYASPNRIGKLRPEKFDDEQRERFRIFRSNGQAVVDARVKTGLLAHGYFMENPAASSDLILLLRDERLPGAEHGRPLTELIPGWYILDDGYPMEAAPLPSRLERERAARAVPME